MNKQSPLWYDTDAEAINAAITSSGKTFKQVAIALWPAMKMDSAYARLKNCLNESKDEKLSFAEVILICKETSSLDPIYHACDELSLHRPAAKAPADEQAELLKTIHAQQAQLLQTMQRLERTNALQAVA